LIEPRKATVVIGAIGHMSYLGHFLPPDHPRLLSLIKFTALLISARHYVSANDAVKTTTHV
jgi:hypothetical protein